MILLLISLVMDITITLQRSKIFHKYSKLLYSETEIGNKILPVQMNPNFVFTKQEKWMFILLVFMLYL